jgi:Transposase DDE domain
MRTISQIEGALKQVFTKCAQKAGRKSGFVQRRSKLSASKWVQTLTFGYLSNPQSTLCELSQTAAACGCQITAQGIDERFSLRAAECLREVLKQAVKVMVRSNSGGVKSTLLGKFREVRVTDSTTIQLPKELSTEYRGCGGLVTKVDSSMKASVGWELCNGKLIGPVLGEGRTQDRRLEREHPPIEKGALDLCDLGYYSIDRLKELDERKAYFITHIQFQTSIFDSAGQKHRLVELIDHQEGKSLVDLPVMLSNKQLPCRLVAAPVSRIVADERRRKIRRKLKARGKNVAKERLKLAGWNIYVTNVPEKMLTAEQVLSLARVRWQIELLFKLWKSLGRLDEWRSEKPEKILCEIYAKLLAMIVAHWVMLTGVWGKPDRSIWKAVRYISNNAERLLDAMRQDHVEAVLKSLERSLKTTCNMEKRKKHPATFQLLMLESTP